MNKKEPSPKYLADSKKRFTDILERKMKTTFIGALSEFQRKFGFLWDDDEYQYNEDANRIIAALENAGVDVGEFRELWSETRERILNNGNNQLRALFKELETYTLHWNRYKLDILVKEQE